MTLQGLMESNSAEQSGTILTQSTAHVALHAAPFTHRMPVMISATQTAGKRHATWLRHGVTAVLCLLLAGACDWFRSPPPKADNFPVVVPFALDKAGNTVRVAFELPPPTAKGNLRPVFIGFRTVWPPAKARTPEQARRIEVATEYLDKADVPLRLTLTKVDGAGVRPTNVILDDQYTVAPDQPGSPWRHKTRTNPNGLFKRHRGAGADSDEMVRAGRYDINSVYIEYKIAGIPTPSPGRYVIRADNIETHTELTDVSVELIISHYYHK